MSPANRNVCAASRSRNVTGQRTSVKTTACVGGFSYGRRGRMARCSHAAMMMMMMIRTGWCGWWVWWGGAVSHRCRRPRALSLSFQPDAQNSRKKRTAESRRRMERDESWWRAVVAIHKPPGVTRHLPRGRPTQGTTARYLAMRSVCATTGQPHSHVGFSVVGLRKRAPFLDSYPRFATIGGVIELCLYFMTWYIIILSPQWLECYNSLPSHNLIKVKRDSWNVSRVCS